MKIAYTNDMFNYYFPQNFHELVEAMREMDFDEWVDNYDTGHHRVVEIGSSTRHRYELYEDREFLGYTPDVVAAAQFIAEGWEY